MLHQPHLDVTTTLLENLEFPVLRTNFVAHLALHAGIPATTLKVMYLRDPEYGIYEYATPFLNHWGWCWDDENYARDLDLMPLEYIADHPHINLVLKAIDILGLKHYGEWARAAHPYRVSALYGQNPGSCDCDVFNSEYTFRYPTSSASVLNLPVGPCYFEQGQNSALEWELHENLIFSRDPLAKIPAGVCDCTVGPF